MSINSGNQMRAKRTQNANQNENKQSKKINLQTGVSVAHYTSKWKFVGSARLWVHRKNSRQRLSTHFAQQE